MYISCFPWWLGNQSGVGVKFQNLLRSLNGVQSEIFNGDSGVEDQSENWSQFSIITPESNCKICSEDKMKSESKFEICFGVKVGSRVKF